MARKYNKHGLRNTRAYFSWDLMVRRCAEHKDYKGRGISVCKRWADSIQAFFEDMGERPEGLTLERVENDLGYWCGKEQCPECGPEKRKSNCRWATRAEQVHNRRNNVWIVWSGRRQQLAMWAKEFGISRGSLSLRIDRYGSVEAAFAISSRGSEDLRARMKGEPCRLTLVSPGTKVGHSKYQCACGCPVKEIKTSHVNLGRVRSCGCLKNRKKL